MPSQAERHRHLAQPPAQPPPVLRSTTNLASSDYFPQLQRRRTSASAILLKSRNLSFMDLIRNDDTTATTRVFSGRASHRRRDYRRDFRDCDSKSNLLKTLC